MITIASCLLALAAVNKVLAADHSEVAECHLPAPRIYGISEFEVNETDIHWLPLGDDAQEPILGYMAKMWEVGCATKRKAFGAGSALNEDRVMPRLRDTSTLRNLQEFTLRGVNNSNLVLKGLLENIPYHVVVLAYSALCEGPASTPFRFQLKGKYSCRT